jgi:hypothetical protein
LGAWQKAGDRIATSRQALLALRPPHRAVNGRGGGRSSLRVRSSARAKGNGTAQGPGPGRQRDADVQMCVQVANLRCEQKQLHFARSRARGGAAGRQTTWWWERETGRAASPARISERICNPCLDVIDKYARCPRPSLSLSLLFALFLLTTEPHPSIRPPPPPFGRLAPCPRPIRSTHCASSTCPVSARSWHCSV